MAAGAVCARRGGVGAGRQRRWRWRYARVGGRCWRSLRSLPTARGLPAQVLDEIVGEASCATVIKPRAIRDEEHLRRAFWLSVKLLLARYREGRHRLRVGSRERADFETLTLMAPAAGLTVAEEVELKDALWRAADFMAQLTNGVGQNLLYGRQLTD
jgi:hypothetical protein